MEVVYKNTDWATYGDDFISVIHADYEWLFNFKEKQKFFTTILGIEYDTPDKDGKTYTTLPLEELSFLSRTFTLSRNVVFPSLKKESIARMLHWVTMRHPNQYVQNLDFALQEAVLWDENYYNLVCKACTLAREWILKNHGVLIPLVILPYNQLRNIVRRQIIAGTR